jgi:hypothetical protein
MILSIVGYFGALVALWVGIVAMGKTPEGRGPVWKLMLAGISIMTITPLSFLGLVGYQLSSLLSFGGTLLFAMGFALHCLSLQAAKGRQAELEMLVASLTRDLEGLRQERNSS